MTDNPTYEHYGVIVGVSSTVTEAMAVEAREHLTARFPGVTFAVVAGAMSVAFPLPPSDSLASFRNGYQIGYRQGRDDEADNAPLRDTPTVDS